MLVCVCVGVRFLKPYAKVVKFVRLCVISCVLLELCVCVGGGAWHQLALCKLFLGELVCC